MIGHAVYLKHLVFVLLKNPGYVLMQSFFPVFINERSPKFNCKNKLNVNLCVGVGQDYLF